MTAQAECVFNNKDFVVAYLDDNKRTRYIRANYETSWVEVNKVAKKALGWRYKYTQYNGGKYHHYVDGKLSHDFSPIRYCDKVAHSEDELRSILKKTFLETEEKLLALNLMRNNVIMTKKDYDELVSQKPAEVTRIETPVFKEYNFFKSKDMITTCSRVVAVILSNGEVKNMFYNTSLKDNSHSELAQTLGVKYRTGFERSKIFGAFYSLMCGNLCTPILYIYGSSCDYSTEKLDKETQMIYYNHFKKLCEEKEWKFVWDIENNLL